MKSAVIEEVPNPPLFTDQASEAKPSTRTGPVQPMSQEHLDRVEKRWADIRNGLATRLAALPADRSTETRLLAQAAGSSSVGKKILWLRKAADQLIATTAPLAACRRGCTHCCHIGVAISRAEALVISRETGVPINPNAGIVFDLDSDHIRSRSKEFRDAGFGKPCPFLKSGDCSIYASRPLPCRLLLNLDVDALLCQLVEGASPEVPYLNTMTHQLGAASILGPNQPYDDIRNWFPGGI